MERAKGNKRKCGKVFRTDSLAGWLLVLAVLGIAFRGAARIYIYYETHRRGRISQRLGLLSQSSVD